jgi:hypothetical protein
VEVTLPSLRLIFSTIAKSIQTNISWYCGKQLQPFQGGERRSGQKKEDKEDEETLHE